ncbi:MAG TPA: MBL fold metallo-hydrolase [Gammaproteobacteria bacterium]|nr:MBL fold metallo-hydrolase [Gammaproteobacteria bacterium]
MDGITSRRQFLTKALGATAAVVGAGALRGAAAQSAPALGETELRNDLSLVTGLPTNVVVLRTAGSAALVDSGPASHAAELAKLVRGRLGFLSVELLFNTHWHVAHTGGNEALRSGDTTIIAHELTRLWMSTEYYVDWEDTTYEPREHAALPTRTFYATDPQPIVAEIGDEEIEYGHLPEAHTDGDIYVWFKNRNVLAAGGVVTHGSYPVIDYATGGWIGGLVDATRKLLAMTSSDTLIVPASGPAQPRAHLTRQLEMLTVVRERIENLMRKGRSIEEMLAAEVTKEFDSAWGDNRERFVANVYNGLWWAGRLSDSL